MYSQKQFEKDVYYLQIIIDQIQNFKIFKNTLY